jgi:subtilisin family serine protease
LFVIAAGNDGGQNGVPDSGNNDVNEVVPANSAVDFSNVITVAATTKEGVLADFSNFSPRSVSLGAWGKAVPSAAPADLSVVMSGTSMASPFVAGVASTMRKVNSKLQPSQLRKILERTVRPSPTLQGRTITGGMVDAKAAVSAARLAVLSDLSTAIEQALKERDFVEGVLPLGLSGLELNLGSDALAKTDNWIKELMRARSR